MFAKLAGLTKGPLAILDLVPSIVWAAMVLFLTVSLGVSYTQGLRMQTKAANATALLEGQRADWERKARDSAETALKLSGELTALKEKNDATIAEEQQRTAVAMRAGDAARGLLLDATRKLAAARPAPGDSAALARVGEIAVAFGDLLGSCDRVAETLGGHAEGLAIQVRGLQRQYLGLQQKYKELRDTLYRLPGGGSPLPDSYDVHPVVPSWRQVVVHASMPVTTFDP